MVMLWFRISKDHKQLSLESLQVTKSHPLGHRLGQDFKSADLSSFKCQNCLCFYS